MSKMTNAERTALSHYSNTAGAVEYGGWLNRNAWPEFKIGTKAVQGNPGELGNFPLYYYCLGHLNMCLKFRNDKRTPPELNRQEKPDGYLDGYWPWLKSATAFRVPTEITKALMNTRLPKDLNRHREIRMPKGNMFIETALQIDYKANSADVYGIHILEANLENLDADTIKNDNLFQRIMETCTFDGKKLDTVQKLVDFINSCGPLRAFKTLHLETNPKDKTERYFDMAGSRINNWPETVQNIHIMWKPEHNVVEKLPLPEKQVRDYVFNYILFVNNPEVEYSLRETPVESNLKRAQKGKLPKPAYALIKLKDRLKRIFLEKQEAPSGQSMTAHAVRGHWRHFYSDKFVNMKGRRRWIPEHSRGEGYSVSRNYDHTENA